MTYLVPHPPPLVRRNTPQIVMTLLSPCDVSHVVLSALLGSHAQTVSAADTTFCATAVPSRAPVSPADSSLPAACFTALTPVKSPPMVAALPNVAQPSVIPPAVPCHATSQQAAACGRLTGMRPNGEVGAEVHSLQHLLFAAPAQCAARELFLSLFLSHAVTACNLFPSWAGPGSYLANSHCRKQHSPSNTSALGACLKSGYRLLYYIEQGACHALHHASSGTESDATSLCKVGKLECWQLCKHVYTSVAQPTNTLSV